MTKCSCGCGCIPFSYGKGKFEIRACAERIGNDAVIMIGGGEKPHAGCVVICEPDKATGKVTASVHNFTTHREEVVARPIAEAICRKIKARVVCICGIHVNNASKKEIALLVKNTELLGKRLLKCF